MIICVSFKHRTICGTICEQVVTLWSIEIYNWDIRFVVLWWFCEFLTNLNLPSSPNYVILKNTTLFQTMAKMNNGANITLWEKRFCSFENGSSWWNSNDQNIVPGFCNFVSKVSCGIVFPSISLYLLSSLYWPTVTLWLPLLIRDSKWSMLALMHDILPDNITLKI